MENDQNQPIDYAAVLADLLARRDVLDKMIEGARALAGQANSPLKAPHGSAAIRGDSFFGMTIPDASKKLLSIQRKPLTAPEIAKHLESGGYSHTSTNFPNTVSGVLNRSAKGEDGIVKVGRGQFGLIEWYPGYKRKGSSKKNGENGDDAQEKDDASDLA